MRLAQACEAVFGEDGLLTRLVADRTRQASSGPQPMQVPPGTCGSGCPYAGLRGCDVITIADVAS